MGSAPVTLKKIIVVLACTFACLSGARAAGNEAESSGKSAGPVVLAHYLPWYASKPFSGVWGWHWTMDRYNPDERLENGQRAMASHDFPLIDLYDCADPAVLECQVLQMKFAGMDGVVIDWYGTRDHNEYAMVHRNTALLIDAIRRAGMKFAICYEDQALLHMTKAGKAKPEDAVSGGQADLGWLQERCFGDPGYVRVAGKPLLLNFGPQYFKKEQWDLIFWGLKERPVFITLPHFVSEAGADGGFGWPPVVNGRHIGPEEWTEYLRDLYGRRAKGEKIVAVAFPGFRDIYEEARLHSSYGRIEERDGRTFLETLERGIESGAEVLQVATWNDYGEGTVVEPTWRMGYWYLEQVQGRLGRLRGGKSFTAEDLRLPHELLKMRRAHGDDADWKERIETVSRLLIEGKTEEARALLPSSP